MSKSLGAKHYVGLFEDEKGIRAKVRSAVTDSDTPEKGIMSQGVTSLFEILKACEKFNDADTLMKDYESGKLQYSHLKEAVADALVTMTSAFRSKRTELIKDKSNIMQQVYNMSDNAREIAHTTLVEVRKLVGLPTNR
jgi:tryptophanyl-tRNA synthetase